jgi:hypothetical protein
MSVTESKIVHTAHDPLKTSQTFQREPERNIGHGKVSVAASYVSRVLSTESKCWSICGISRAFFEVTINQISLNVQSALTKEEQLVLFFSKLKLNKNDSVMSVDFDIPDKTVSNVFHSVLYAMFQLASKKVWWHSRDELKAMMPEKFQLHYSDIRVMIDSIKIPIERPKIVEAQVPSYSNNKSDFTAKFLIGIAPCGMVTYISKTYGGQVTDNHITGDCGILDLLESGDVIVADKGFPLIEKDVLGKRGFLVMPPLIASVRIHMKTAIQRMKTFRILQFIDHTLYNDLDKLLVIISHCINHFGEDNDE